MTPKDSGGRPPIENPKTRVRNIRLTPEQDDYITEQLEPGESFADYVRAKILPKRLRH